MRIYSNEKYIEKKSVLGRRTSMAGLLILMLGMAASFSPGIIQGWVTDGNPIADNPIVQWLYGGGWLYVSMISLLAGFVLGQIGNNNMRRFQRRPDQTVAKALKGFDDRNHLYIWSTPGDLVFAGPSGVYSIVTRDLGGDITVQDDKVKQPFSIRRFFMAFGSESGGMPAVEAQGNADKVTAWLNETTGSDIGDAVKPLVIFTSDNVNLDVTSSSAPIVHHKQLKQHLRGRLRSGSMSKTAMSNIIEALNTEAERRGAELE